ncbi:uncharacterized protein PV09_03865 [Verruconis gallopava]|uniref:Major facilitator superfamily (MFS) profile domain-containing protein n=1 Tax=Verruconis gallopava TaxID=253628 RepID=A0A0D2B210_9PEZI|nr:uncharacterized protein PV09_03865 [Verruconis gallopava]KIW05349.1 hypothetical protein PV09_03865 [Verruconis gallopava]
MAMSETNASNVELQDLGSTTPPDRHGSEENLNRRIVTAQTTDATIPDGGYGWVIVFSCAIVAFWFTGMSYSWGVVQKELVEQNVASASTLSFVGGLTPACISIFAITNARLLMSIGSRWTGILGVFFVGLGGLLVSFAPNNVACLFVCVGLVQGIGTSLSFMAASVTPSQYFLRKRGLANGIVYAGGGLGGTVIALAMEKLIKDTDVAWTFRILGLITIATGIPAAWFLRDRATIKRRTFVEWSLFRDFKFLLLFLIGAIATFPLFVPPFFIPLYSNSIGLSASTGAALVAGFNLSSAFGRVGFGFLCDWIGPIHALFLSLFMSAIGMLTIWPVSQNLVPLTLFVIIGGAANGGFFSTIPTAVGSVFGTAQVATAMGMIVTGWAGGYLLGGPIAGYLLAAFGGEQAGFQAYRPAMYYSGSMSLAAAILVGTLRFRMDRKFQTKI